MPCPKIVFVLPALCVIGGSLSPATGRPPVPDTRTLAPLTSNTTPITDAVARFGPRLRNGVSRDPSPTLRRATGWCC